MNSIILNIAILVLLLAFVLAFIRLLKGPTVNDRILALDLIASIIMAFILCYSVLINNAVYIDITIVISLISFVGTIAISTYLKQKS